MNKFTNRSDRKELLDRDDIPFEKIRVNMQELNLINSKLGGHKITLKGFRELLSDRSKVSVCEIGCGGGDNLSVIYRWCSANNIKIAVSGIDINPHCISFARETTNIPGADFIISDYNAVRFINKPDIIYASLFCHHFTDRQLVEMFRWMYSNSTVGFFINDLHRHPLAYYFIKWATRIFSNSRLVKNDAPLSVLRGFRKKELIQLLDRAGLHYYSLRWKWAFRYLVTVAKERDI